MNECPQSRWWILEASGSLAEITAVTASILFVVLAIVITARVGDDSSAALVRIFLMLFPGLATMLVAGLLFALIPGEQGVARAAVMAVPAAALLAVSVLATFVALAWTVSNFVQGELAERVQSSAVWAAHVIWVVGATEVYLTVVNAEHHVCHPNLGRFATREGWPAVAAGMGVALLMSVLALVLRRLRRREVPFLVERTWPLYIGLLAIFAAYNVAALKPSHAWGVAEEKPKGSGIFVTIVSTPQEFEWITYVVLGYLLVFGFMLLLALPYDSPTPDEETSGDGVALRPEEATG